jgi:hypothetical protein
VPLFDDRGRVQAVFELYEPIDRLDGILARATAAPAIVPMVLMALLVTALWRLVSRAQGDIVRTWRWWRGRIESCLGAGDGGRARDRRWRTPRRLVLSLYQMSAPSQASQKPVRRRSWSPFLTG